MDFFRQIAREPGRTGSCFIDEDQVCGFGLQLAHKLINGGLSGAHSAKEDDFSVVSFGHLGNRNGLLVNIQTAREWARLGHG
jgi:hypothetical protein